MTQPHIPTPSPRPATERDIVDVRREPALTIEAPRWFHRLDFLAFLQGRAPHQTGRPATWCSPTDAAADDASDVFVTYDDGEGSDTNGIPDDIWATICEVCRHHGMRAGIVRLSSSGYHEAESRRRAAARRSHGGRRAGHDAQ